MSSVPGQGDPFAMNTSASLLERLRVEPVDADWRRLHDLYTPLIRVWLRSHTLHPEDVDDLVQEVLTVVIRRLPEFDHNQRTGAFRTWLKRISVNCLRDFWKARRYRPRATGDSDFQQMLDALEDPNSAPSQAWNEAHDLHVTRKLLESLEVRFEPRTWQAFRRFALDGEPAETVARELGITSNAVFIAKSRVLAQLRQEAKGLIE